MNRQEVIQKIIDATGAKRYLEIGVYQGTTFLKIKCRHKIAVDPDFRIPLRGKIRWFLRNLGSYYYSMTSDVFFGKYKKKWKFGVVFIDGLHSYHQSFIDLERTIGLLDNGGVIVMHDCNPPYAAAAIPAGSWEEAAAMKIPGWTGEWNGDVWKTILMLRSTRKDLRICVLDCDYGLGLLALGAPAEMLDLTENQIDGLTYEDLASNRKKWLNLKPSEYLAEFLKIS